MLIQFKIFLVVIIQDTYRQILMMRIVAMVVVSACHDEVRSITIVWCSPSVTACSGNCGMYEYANKPAPMLIDKPIEPHIHFCLFLLAKRFCRPSSAI